MKLLSTIIFLTLITNTQAYYDDDISVAEACQDKYNQLFPSGDSEVFFDVEGEAVLRRDFFGNEYWHLVNNDTICYVTYDNNGYIQNVEVEIAD